MSSEVDVKRLVDAARNLVKRSTDRMIRGSLEWDLAQSLAPFAAERGVKNCKIVPPTTDCGITFVPTTGRNAPMYDPADVAFKPSPSVPTPEQVVDDTWDNFDWDGVAHGKGPGLRAVVTAMLTADRAAVTATLRARLEALEADHLRACQTVAAMHAAAVGDVRGPIRGVVEDVAELRNTLTLKDHIIKQLQSDLSSAMVAKGKLIEERDDLEQARQLQYAEINRLNYLAEESKERHSATIAALEAKLAAGGGDAELLETARAVFPAVLMSLEMSVNAGKTGYTEHWREGCADEAVKLARALHAALAAKGADRG